MASSKTEHKEVTGVNVSIELGEKLKTAREAQNLSIERVAEQLKISPRHLYFFESGDFELSQLDPFQRGYIRNYADRMAVSLAEYESLFPEAMQVGSRLQTVDDEEHISKPMLSIATLRIISILLIIVIIVALIALNL
ncbi:MAG: helix-turn-helix domain-containing protein [Hydrogenovibrio sp.]